MHNLQMIILPLLKQFCAETLILESTATATLDEDSAPDGFGADMDAPNVWYTYTGSGTAETITLNLCTSLYDTSVLVYTGTSGSLTLVAGNDDDATCGVGLTTRSRLNFDSDGLTTYYIAIEGWNVGSTGAYTMDVTCAATNPPAVSNQTCATALDIPVDASVNDSDNSYGDISPTQPTCDTFGSIQDVWFSFTAASATTDVTVTNGTMTSSNYSVYSGDCATLVSLGCRSNLTAANTLSLTTLTAGNVYYVQVWSNAAEQGTFTISLSDPSVCLPVATFAKVTNCPLDTTFNVTADITSLASATSVTVTDNQGSSPQTVSSAGLVNFGPYAFGTSVVLTVTNDQSPSCTLVSTAQTQAACPPANDDCASAVDLSIGGVFADNAIVGTTVGGSATTGLVFACQTNRTSDVWYTVTVPNSGTLNLETDAAAASPLTDSVLSVFSGTCGSLTEIGCDDDAGNLNFSKVILTGLTPGDVLYVGVWRYGTGSDGEFQLSAYDPSLAVASFNDGNFKSYPNPVKNVLNLSYDKAITNVAVFNLLGQEVMTKALNSNTSQIDMSHLSNGTYMVKVTADNQVKTIKVVKQ